MAHGEFIMLGACSAYVVQLFVPGYTLSLLVALPVAFAVTFTAGAAMERLVIRHLAHRPLETLLATFGISIALQQIAKLTFGLGSGIAGIAIGLYAQVTTEMGANHIVQSFMTVVVGGVGNVWGTPDGAALIGGLQKGIERLNPSNTLAAQTYMILFTTIFIQFRPRGIVALEGRAAGHEHGGRFDAGISARQSGRSDRSGDLPSGHPARPAGDHVRQTATNGKGDRI